MPIEKGILCGISTEGPDSYKETELLANTASVRILETIIQSKTTPDAAYFIGKGKVDEIRKRSEEIDANVIIFNNNLRPNQQRNLEELINKKIVDRCMLILDIFARHARTTEGKLQVELAQLVYLLPRLSGKGKELSQLGGGIGTRGPGETKLEVDKRNIRDRIEFLKGKLEVVRAHRKVMREGRKAKGFLNATLVGYTNSGKSTLLNLLTKSNVLAENKLFSTLDPTTRKLYLSSKSSILLTDTVGFIRNLPAELVTSFRATLEEIEYSDIIIMVLDASRLDLEVQLEAVHRELRELKVLEKPIITVLNKADLVQKIRIPRLKNDYPDAIFISAKESMDIPSLISKISLISNELLTKS
ncbi:MAG: GTPase HflX [Candidatus Firestonebacteria bacterium RIFOXYA2_FULL_40_8]|nr:MAG: GTPase HflX [Candidatus Firestonebacteria bacterium RIFOXYA2_FULL_40_8]